jgi:hypothetical protein
MISYIKIVRAKWMAIGPPLGVFGEKWIAIILTAPRK